MENSTYDKSIFIGFLIQGRLKDAVRYLEQADECGFLEQYKKVMVGREYDFPKVSERMRQILTMYYDYYVDVFWEGISPEEGEQALLERIITAFNLESGTSMEDAEQILKNNSNEEGYGFLGGKTSGFYGPYIWYITEPVLYQIELPDDTTSIKVNMLDGFISLSWLNFISLGNCGTGGWCNEEGLFCVKNCYVNKLETPDFQVSYLKHEACHQIDIRKYGERISSEDLEYRAKLVELIYYPDLTKWSAFRKEADSSNPENSHSFSAYAVLNKLSDKIFSKESVLDEDQWRGKILEVSQASKELLREHTAEADRIMDGEIRLLRKWFA